MVEESTKAQTNISQIIDEELNYQVKRTPESSANMINAVFTCVELNRNKEGDTK